MKHTETVIPDPRALIFRPPPQSDVELVAGDIMAFIDEVEAEVDLAKAVDAKTYEDLGAKAKTITTTINKLKAAKTEKRKPFTGIADEISKAIDPVIKRFESVKEKILAEATAYAVEQERKAREAERQARIAQEAAEKAQRDAEEKARKAAEKEQSDRLAAAKKKREEEAAAAIEAGEDPFGDTVFTGEEEDAAPPPPPVPLPAAPPPAPAPMIAKPAQAKTGGLRTMRVPVWRVVDSNKVPREYLMVNESAVRQAVKNGIIKPDNDDGRLTLVDGWIEVEIKTEVKGGR